MYRFVRYLEFSQLFEHFFLAAIVTIVGIRFYLQVTGYPQLGSGELHIAHMLWGGLFMVIALLGSLVLLNNDAKHLWAVLGGAGFGSFIDEVGKFVTNDNNYFYQPSFAIMYVVFVSLYFLYRNIWLSKGFSSEEYLINTVEELKEVVNKELDQDELKKAVSYLSQSDPNNPITKFLKRSLKEMRDIPPPQPTLYQRARSLLAFYYFQLISHPWVLNIVVIFFILRSADFLVRGGDAIIDILTQPWPVTLERLLMLRGVLPMINFVGLLTQAGFTILGALQVRRSKIKAFRSFRNSLLVSIIVLQVFNFYEDPLFALAATVRDVVLVTMLEYVINKEKDAKAAVLTVSSK